MIAIRPSTSEEGVRVLQIWRDAVAATHDFLMPEDRSAIDTEVSVFLPAAPLWVGVDGTGDILGFMLLDGPHMEALFIDPEERGTGVGRALVNHALALHGVVTTDVNEQNGQAVGFYRHLGFTPTGRSE